MFNPHFPEGPSPDGPEVAPMRAGIDERIIAGSGPSGDGPSGYIYSRLPLNLPHQRETLATDDLRLYERAQRETFVRFGEIDDEIL